MLQKTYVPMKPIIDLHTEETTMVTVEADATNYDNPHFSTSMHHSKGLLEDLQDTMDCTSATVNPPQSPFEISQSPSACFDKAEEVSPSKRGHPLHSIIPHQENWRSYRLGHTLCHAVLVPLKHHDEKLHL